MEYQNVKNSEMEEDISGSFLCCVCLELLYKPVVLSCGHLSCFWCVHKSMSAEHVSHCPICRDPYLHFPSVCLTLHFLLKKLYPRGYRKREEDVLKEELEHGDFSPQIDANELKAAPESSCNGVSVQISDKGIEDKESSSAGKSLTTTADGDKDNIKKDNAKILMDELLCSGCEKLLVRPVVLNCGHVFCEACVTNPGEDEKIICQECQSVDPRGFPKVCLVLEQFLEEKYPEEYACRRAITERLQPQNRTQRSQPSRKKGPSFSPPQDLFWWANPNSNIHLGAGCDSCGRYPIVGDRYRCKDCKEKIGYDLCSDCYNTRSKLPGRFNQQHTPDHRLERVDVPQLELVTRLIEEQRNAIVFFQGSPANPASDPGSDHDSEENQNEDRVQ